MPERIKIKFIKGRSVTVEGHVIANFDQGLLHVMYGEQGENGWKRGSVYPLANIRSYTFEVLDD